MKGNYNDKNITYAANPVLADLDLKGNYNSRHKLCAVANVLADLDLKGKAAWAQILREAFYKFPLGVFPFLFNR